MAHPSIFKRMCPFCIQKHFFITFLTYNVSPITIVYFYPKDGTPNCTIQALDFSLMKKDFNNH
jgi:peroxiredoxin